MNEQTESWLDVRLIRFYAIGIFQDNFYKVTFFLFLEEVKFDILTSSQVINVIALYLS